MQSREGAIFFVINIVGNFGTVFLDSTCFCPHTPRGHLQPYFCPKDGRRRLGLNRLTASSDGYYNKAIAASPVHALPGYILGGLSWFAIPWLTATTMGLSALALESVSGPLFFLSFLFFFKKKTPPMG